MSGTTAALTPEVVVVGGGPAGLTAATELAPRLQGEVLVLDREATAGGIPRHSDHPGYGVRDMRRFLGGPDYARRLVDGATRAGATVLTHATVTGWSGPRSLEVTTPQGLRQIDARAVILATGARERPRPARLIPGDRPRGIYTTGQLQNLVHLHRRKLPGRAVVVGAELVSWSAVVTLRDAGARTVLMTTTHSAPESYAAFNLPGKLIFRVPVATHTRLTRIIGKPHLRAVEIEDIRTGLRRMVECDTLVLTGDWIPDHELARSAGLAMDRGTQGPLVDTALRTSAPGVFAIGNLVHPVDTADAVALDGRHVTQHVLDWLSGYPAASETVELHAAEPFRWVTPGLLRPGDPAPARDRLLLWSNELVRHPRVLLRQDGKVIARRRIPWPASPGRVFRVPWSTCSVIDPKGGPVQIGLT